MTNIRLGIDSRVMRYEQELKDLKRKDIETEGEEILYYPQSARAQKRELTRKKEYGDLQKLISTYTEYDRPELERRLATLQLREGIIHTVGYIGMGVATVGMYYFAKALSKEPLFPNIMGGAFAVLTGIIFTKNIKYSVKNFKRAMRNYRNSRR